MAHLLQQQQQQQQHSLFSQASWGRLEMKPERNKFKKKWHIYCTLKMQFNEQHSHTKRNMVSI